MEAVLPYAGLVGATDAKESHMSMGLDNAGFSRESARAYAEEVGLDAYVLVPKHGQAPWRGVVRKDGKLIDRDGRTRGAVFSIMLDPDPKWGIPGPEELAD